MATDKKDEKLYVFDDCEHCPYDSKCTRVICKYFAYPIDDEGYIISWAEYDAERAEGKAKAEAEHSAFLAAETEQEKIERELRDKEFWDNISEPAAEQLAEDQDW